MFYAYKLTIIFVNIIYIYIYNKTIFTIATIIDLSQYRCFFQRKLIINN